MIEINQICNRILSDTSLTTGRKDVNLLEKYIRPIVEKVKEEGYYDICRILCRD